MIECDTSLKRWGNSMGVVIPKKELSKAKLGENSRVHIIVTPTKRLKVRDIFGKLPGWKKPTSKIMAEIKKDLDSKFF